MKLGRAARGWAARRVRLGGLTLGLTPAAGWHPAISCKSLPMWTLRTCVPNGTGPTTFRLSAGAVKTLGRATRADFVVDAALVSRFHCRLSVTAIDILEVEDLQSTNGTWVNDQRVLRLQLTAGDRLRIGRVEMTVERD